MTFLVSLTILSSAAELTINQIGDTSAQHIRMWLQPSARHAEDILRRLRNLHLPHSSLVTDLTQSLTVLVLAADMIAQGQLSGAVMPELYALMRRNAERTSCQRRDLLLQRIACFCDAGELLCRGFESYTQRIAQRTRIETECKNAGDIITLSCKKRNRSCHSRIAVDGRS